MSSRVYTVPITPTQYGLTEFNLPRGYSRLHRVWLTMPDKNNWSQFDIFVDGVNIVENAVMKILAADGFFIEQQNDNIPFWNPARTSPVPRQHGLVINCPANGANIKIMAWCYGLSKGVMAHFELDNGVIDTRRYKFISTHFDIYNYELNNDVVIATTKLGSVKNFKPIGGEFVQYEEGVSATHFGAVVNSKGELVHDFDWSNYPNFNLGTDNYPANIDKNGELQEYVMLDEKYHNGQYLRDFMVKEYSINIPQPVRGIYVVNTSSNNYFDCSNCQSTNPRISTPICLLLPNMTIRAITIPSIFNYYPADSTSAYNRDYVGRGDFRADKNIHKTIYDNVLISVTDGSGTNLIDKLNISLMTTSVNRPAEECIIPLRSQSQKYNISIFHPLMASNIDTSACSPGFNYLRKPTGNGFYSFRICLIY